MDSSASPENPSVPPQASLRSAPSPPPQPSPPPAPPLPAPPLANLCSLLSAFRFPPRAPRRQTTDPAGSTSGTGRPPLGVRTSQPAPRTPSPPPPSRLPYSCFLPVLQIGRASCRER